MRRVEMKTTPSSTIERNTKGDKSKFDKKKRERVVEDGEPVYDEADDADEDDNFIYDSVPESVTFRPTEDEFKDPLLYINSIRPIAEQYGICKIIPPKYWKPKFSLDMNTFKFTPRVQRLNELEANTRIKINFLEKLSKFWELQGHTLRIPILERKQIDLYDLFKNVEEMGGYEEITKLKMWSRLSRHMKFKELTSSRTLRIHFEKILYPYLLFESGVSLPTHSNPHNPNDTEMREHDDEGDSETESKAKRKSIDAERIESIRCLVCSRGDDEAFMLLCDECDDSYHTFCLYPPIKEIPKGDWRCPPCVAKICKEQPDTYGFCQSHHQYTLNEFGAMANKFKSDYFKKPHNMVTGDECERAFWRILSSAEESISVEYGADLHTMITGSGFPTRSSKDKSQTANNQEYVSSPWNLNNLSLLEKSVLSQMNVEISGMKIPWAYVGMCFSCFCWHVEDHWSYSINYLHWGETKTWYGVPGSDAEKFEQVMRQKAPELFEKAPDLLHHLVTIMNPSKLRANGVPIYKLNQNAGDFIVTFPRAYHAGFNQGFNFAEAVNFCPADWIPIGREAIEHYKAVKRHTVFSHDELIFKVATNQDFTDLDAAYVIQDEIGEIIEIERQSRQALMDQDLIKNTRKLSFELLGDDERTCCFCKTTCFLSAVRSPLKPDMLACLNHFAALFQANEPKHKQKLTLLYRYSLEEMQAINLKLKQRILEYEEWCDKVEQVLYAHGTGKESTIKMEREQLHVKPHVNYLFDLLDAAKMRRYPRYDITLNSCTKTETTKSSKSNVVVNVKANSCLVNELEKQVHKANNCAKLCKHFIEIFSQNSDARARSNRYKRVPQIQHDANDSCTESKEDVVFLRKSTRTCVKQVPSLDELKKLATDIQELVCEIDERELFVTLFNEAIEYEKRINQLIAEWNLESSAQLKRVLDYLDSVDIEFPLLSVEQLKLMYKQACWIELVNKSIEDADSLSMSTIKDLIEQALNENLLVNLSEDDKSRVVIQNTFNDLKELLKIAETWDEKARCQIDSKRPLKLVELEKTLHEARCIPTYMENVERLERIIKDAQQLSIKAVQLIKESNTLPYLSDLKSLYKKASQLPVVLDDMPLIEMRIKFADKWNHQVFDLFKHNVEQEFEQALLVECLSPKIDLNELMHRLFHHSNKRSEMVNSKYKSAKKRVRSKTISEMNQPSNDVSQEIQNVNDLTEFYAQNKNLTHLSEKYKALQLKELDALKQMRKSNSDLASSLCVYLEAKQKQNDSPQIVEPNIVDSETAKRTDDNKKAEGEQDTFPNVKCCSCFKTIVSNTFPHNLVQCSLCLGISHNSCSFQISHDNKNDAFCSNCKRTQRPRIDSIMDMLVAFKKLQVKSYEGNAFQMFVNRILNWQENFKHLFDSADLKSLHFVFVKAKTSTATQSTNDLMKLYDALSYLRKAELDDLYLEGLLLECELDEMKDLNELFYLLNKYAKNDSSTQKLRNHLRKYKNNAATSLNNSLDTSQKPQQQTIGFELKKKKDQSVEKKKEENSSNLKEKKAQKKQREKKEIKIEDEEFCAAPGCTGPTGDNIKWVQCEGVCGGKWFHMICVGLTKIRKKEQYLCANCESTSNKNPNESRARRESENQVDENDKDEYKQGVNNENTRINKKQRLDFDSVELKK